jgi:DNA-binding NtrC family response regulator
VAAPESAPLLTVRVGATLDDVGRRLIEATLAECGSKRKAADMLGISLKTLYNRLAAYKASELDADEDEESSSKPSREEHRRAA